MEILLKKYVNILLALTLSASLLTACGSSPAQDSAAADTSGTPEAEETESSTPEAEEESTPEATEAPLYKDIMVPYDELEPANHIVVLQNTLHYTRDGFYTEDTAPVAEELDYNGQTVSAYPVSCVLNFLNQAPAGELTVTKTDETAMAVSAEDFAGMYVIIDDFQSGNAPVFYNPATGTEITEFFYAVTAEGEAIFSIVSGAQYIVKDIVAMVGWDDTKSYTVCATDKFHIPVEPDYMAIGDLRGTLSGAVNGSFGDMTIASGKISDVVIVQPLQEE